MNVFIVDTLDGVVDLTKRVINSPSLDLTTGQVSELQFDIADDGFELIRAGVLRETNTLTYKDLGFEIAALGTTGGSAKEYVRVTCRPRGVQRLRRDYGHLIEASTTPTDWLKKKTDGVGLRFVGQSTAVRPNITRLGPSQGSEFGESSWDVGLRLAGEEGFYFYESAGVVYFGQPTWLIGQASNAPPATVAGVAGTAAGAAIGATAGTGTYPAGPGYPEVSRPAWGPGPDINIAVTFLMTAAEEGASPRIVLAGLEALLVESRCQNINFGDKDSVGPFQQRNAWAPYAVRMNPVESCRMFLRGGQGGQKGALHYDATGIDYKGRRIVRAGDLAQAVQVSAPAAYNGFEDRARDLQAQAVQNMPSGFTGPTNPLIPEVQALIAPVERVESPPRPDVRVWVVRYPEKQFANELTPLQVPEVRRSVDDPEAVTLDIVVNHEQGLLFRPGDCIALYGIPTFEAPYLVTGVPITLDGASSIRVSAVRPADPQPQPPNNEAPGDGEGVSDTDADPDNLGNSGGTLQGTTLTGAAVSGKGMIWPVPGSICTSWPGAGRSGGRTHRGNDIGRAGGAGDPVYAVADGVVERSGVAGKYGNVIDIKHNIPGVGQILTVYAHNQRNLVRVGQTVRQGDHIAEMGSTGNAAPSFPHVHFEIRTPPFNYDRDTHDIRNGWLP